MIDDPFDLLIVGGGINGAGIARDAAGRGLKVILVEQDDLAAHTSSASTGLIHGGLRYLEHGAFRLVRESLVERSRLMGIAPHLIRPLRFVVPPSGGMRPNWLIRLGLFIYDALGPRVSLPGSARVTLDGPFGAPLRSSGRHAFAYSDCIVDDARLTILNAVDAAERGAVIRTRTRFLGAARIGNTFKARLSDRRTGKRSEIPVRAIVNAAGPWVREVAESVAGSARERPPRLVKGSHIVVARRYHGDHAYLFQNTDGRVMFAIPHGQAFTLIGTTDVPYQGDPASARIDGGEIAYLCDQASRHFREPVTPADIVYSYSGVRPLYDDGTANPSRVTRDYVLKLDATPGPLFLSIFGGKITTYRRLAERALHLLSPGLPRMGLPWTHREPLPGGDFEDVDALSVRLRAKWPFLRPQQALRLARSYGARAATLLGDVRSAAELGPDVGGGLTIREIDYLVRHEWAMTAEDILWRRSRLGLQASPETREAIRRHVMGDSVTLFVD